MNPADRAQVLTDAIYALKAQVHALLEADLWAAADEVARCHMTLGKQYELMVVDEHAVVEASKR
jgi:hypothetical protein